MAATTEQQLTIPFPEPETPPRDSDAKARESHLAEDRFDPRTIPVESYRSDSEMSQIHEPPPPLPARWEDVTIEARNRNVFAAVVEKLRDVPAHQHLAKLITLSRDEGYAWVVFGMSGSGKSAFFQTLDFKFRHAVRTLIINAKDHDLINHLEFTNFLTVRIREHVDREGPDTPLIVVLEGREQAMSSEERSSVCQALRNVLRAPGPGRKVVFVLPVNNLNQANLFLQQAQETGVAVSKEGVYSFVGPDYIDHPDIVSDLFSILNGRSIEEYGVLHSDLQSLSSSQQTVGEYIRTIRDELIERNRKYQRIVDSYGYRPITVITCFVSPEPAYITQRVIKGMTTGSFGHINPGEILRVTRGNRARKWDEKGQVLAKIIHALDIRVVEFPPDIVMKLFYAWGWPEGGYKGRKRVKSAVARVEDRLAKEDLNFKRPTSVHQNLRQQLKGSNLFRVITGEETRRIDGTKLGHIPEAALPSDGRQRELDRRKRERATTVVTELACELASNYQLELHTMIARGLDDALRHYSSTYPRIAGLKTVSPESYLSFLDKYHREQKSVRPDIVIETQDRLITLEFYWRNKQLSDAEIASYVLGKIEETYLTLPMIKALDDLD